MSFTSVLKKVEGGAETIAHVVEKDIAKLWGAAPGFETVALTALKVAGPTLEVVVGLEGGPSANTAVTKVINEAETDIIAAQNLTTSIGTTPSVKSILSGVATNLSSLDTLAGFKNPESKTKVDAVVATIQALVDSFPESTTPVSGTPGESTPQQ